MMCLEHHLTLSLSGNSFLPEELRVMCTKNVWYPAKIAMLGRFRSRSLSSKRQYAYRKNRVNESEVQHDIQKGKKPIIVVVFNFASIEAVCHSRIPRRASRIRVV